MNIENNADPPGRGDTGLGRIPSLNWLRVFEAAARTESFARAAETLNMSAPAVSQQVRALETHLGRALFVRGPRSVTLTDAGQAYLPVVAQALHSVEVMSATLFGAPGREPLIIRASPLFANGWLAARLGRFQEQEPDVQLSLWTEGTTQTFAPSNVDLEIAFGDPQRAAGDGDLLFGETIYPVAIPAIVAEITSAEDLVRYPLIEVATHRANWLTLLPAAIGAPRITHVDTTGTAFAIASTGQGIALARAPASDHQEIAYGLIPCLPALGIAGVHAYALTYPARSKLSRAAGAFRNWLLEEVQRDGRAGTPPTTPH